MRFHTPNPKWNDLLWWIHHSCTSSLIIWGWTRILIAYNYLSYPVNLCTVEQNFSDVLLPKESAESFASVQLRCRRSIQSGGEMTACFYCCVSTLRIPFCCFYIQSSHSFGHSLTTLWELFTATVHLYWFIPFNSFIFWRKKKEDVCMKDYENKSIFEQ